MIRAHACVSDFDVIYSSGLSMSFITSFQRRRAAAIAIVSFMGAAVLCGCSGSTEEVVPPDDAQALYLRGDMNDYAVSEVYRLKTMQYGACTEAALHADWSPYHFKFADRNWTAGSNYGYALPPGVLEDGSRDVKLNASSTFEDVTLRIKRDGVYRFCLVKRDDGAYATVTRVEDGSERTFAENLLHYYAGSSVR